ncbi:hypothetical protein MPB2EB_1336 [Mycoavidus sp. B2-EB]|nr:hypothetical protein MPB2EB_1336 [Mycoavidus sp. B2-EB]
MEGVLAFGRPRTWYAKFSPWGEKIYGLSALTPESALRDCYLYAHKTDMWCPKEDDLDLPEKFYAAKSASRARPVKNYPAAACSQVTPAQKHDEIQDATAPLQQMALCCNAPLQ